MKTVVAIARRQFRDLARHQRRIAQGVGLAVGRRDVGVLQVRIAFDPGAFFHVDTAVLGVPAPGQDDVAEMRACAREHELFDGGPLIDPLQENRRHAGDNQQQTDLQQKAVLQPFPGRCWRHFQSGFERQRANAAASWRSEVST